MKVKIRPRYQPDMSDEGEGRNKVKSKVFDLGNCVAVNTIQLGRKSRMFRFCGEDNEFCDAYARSRWVLEI